MKKYELFKEACLIFDLRKPAEMEHMNETIEQVCVLPPKDCDGGYEDFKELNIIVVNSWKTYTYLYGYSKLNVDDYIEWHNNTYSKVKLGGVYFNEVMGSKN